MTGGRFRSRLHPRALAFSSSLNVDRELYREDLLGSIAHVTMLAKQKIIPRADAQKIAKALQEIGKEIESGKLSLSAEKNSRFTAEDIHMAIEARLIKKVGAIGGKLHTA